MQVRAQQYRSPGQLELTLTALELESAEARDTGLGRTPFVEQVRGDIHTSDKKGRKNNIINCYVQCLCPAGYTGLSCETCAPGYEREAGGTCRRPVTTCPPGYYADTRAGGGECRVCPCPLTTPSNQFTRDCFLDVDSQVGVQATCPGHVSRVSPGHVPLSPGLHGPQVRGVRRGFHRQPHPHRGCLHQG